MAEIIRCDESFDQSLFSGASCAFGVFDGVHRGHRYLLSCACETARESSGASIALTFDRDPDELFRADALKKLMTNEERICALAASGIDVVAVLPFTREFASLEPAAFLERTFGTHAPAHLHVGCDFRFGAKAAGAVADLASWGEVVGCAIHAHDLKSDDGAPITATRIRGLLAACDIEEANRLLGHPYTVSGTVERGRGEGRDMGFRTANLSIDPELLSLGEGVYAAWAHVGERRYKAAVSVGVSPVFAEAKADCEAHLLDFEGDLYGQPVRISFEHFLRPMIKFDSVDELIATVMGNIEWVRENL